MAETASCTDNVFNFDERALLLIKTRMEGAYAAEKITGTADCQF